MYDLLFHRPVRFLFFVVLACFANVGLIAAPNFAQGNYATPQSPSATVTVSYKSAQTAGNLNIVVVGWNDTAATVQQVKDSAGNAYNLAIGPTTGTALRQSIYYARSILGGANTVTVTFSQAAAYPDVRILEYQGVNTLDVTAAASGSSTSASSGAATTKIANELVFGANMVATSTKAAGSGYTSRMITAPDGDIAEDKVVTATGSNTATAALSSSGPWIMQMATFYQATGPAPTVTSVSPVSGPAGGGTPVTITGTNFAAGATVTFGSTAAANVVVVSATQITATTPPGSAGAVTVTATVSGQSGSLPNGFTYVPQPTVSTVSPNSGPPTGGTPVTITGTNFAAGATVTFGSTAATNVVVVSATQITAATPAGSPGFVNVTVTVNGQSGSLANGFTYILPPVVSSVSPNTGSTGGGTAVTITGTNFAAGATITFGSAAATNVVVANNTTITATTPAGTTGPTSVTVTVGTQSGTLPNGFTYVIAPSVTSISPNTGPTAGGTPVTITGTNFASGATVTFGTAAATNVTVVSATQITANTPASNAGAVAVTVSVNGQSGSLANGFTYTLPPTVTTVSPNSGSPTGGTAVTITGANFATGAGVTFGSAAATNVVVVNSTTITATTPAGTVGATTVTVTVGGQSGSLTNGFTYAVATNISYVQGNYATPQSSQSSVGVTFTSAQTAGNLNVVVVGWNDTTATVTGITDKSGNTYTRAVGPTIVSGSLSQSIYYARNIAPAAAGANTVTVTFSAAAAFPDVRILEYSGADPANPVDVVAANTGSGSTSSTNSVATTNPTDLLFGANIVTSTTSAPGTGFTTRLLTSPDGDIAEDRMVTTAGSYNATASISSGNWIMQMVAFRTASGGVALPTVTNVSPNSGPAAGGTPVTITGTNFAAGASVTFAGTPATNVVVVSATQITATTPPGSGGAVTITVVVNGVSGSLSNGFTYIATPTVTAVSPNSGPPTGGTAVTITGSNFVSGATVTFGGAAATNVVVVSATQITATTPAGSLGSVTVSVTNPGSQIGSLANGFTYANSGTPTAPTNFTAVNGGAAPVYVNGQGYYNSTSLTTHTTAPFDSTSGDLILLFASSHAGVTFTPSDNFGNTWISIAGPTNTTLGFDLRSQVWYAPTPVVGAGHTIMMNLSLSQPLVMSIVVLKGSNLSSPVDAISLIGSDNGTSTTSVVSPTLNTSFANDLLVGFVKTNGTETFTAGAGFTIQSATTVLNLTAETETATGPGSYAATFTLSSGVTWQSVVGAAAKNPNQITLSWTASTETGGTISKYLVERCSGAQCSNFIQIGSTTTTGYNDLGLTASTSYSYRVRAQDTVGALGPYSSVSTATTPAAIPSLPGNLTATGASSTQVNLSWIASTETGGSVTNYLVERCQGSGCTNFAQIGTSPTTVFGDTSLTPGTIYNYRVRATDAVGNLSPYSNISTATTSGAPTDPTNLVATAISSNQINLTWTASTESGGTVTGYLVERCQGVGCSNFARLLTVPTNSYSDAGLSPSTSYTYHVKATDANGTFSNYSNLATAVTPAQGTTISYVQGAYATPQGPQSTVSITFTGAQIASDLNVVAVGWNDSTAVVTAVTDTAGNTYTRAVGPTTITGVESQSIYYAKNIAAAAAGSNTVTVTFSPAAAYPDIRILEYSGADPISPVDVVSASTGNSANSSSGTVTTTNATDLLFGANIVQTITTGPGSGFTSRLLTSPDADIAEDEMVASTGAYSATAPLSSGQWIMQLVAFRTPSGLAVPVVTLSPTALNLGNEATGNTSNPQAATLTNTGTAPLTIGSIMVSGGNASDFAQSNNCGPSIAPQASCTINVTFTPTITGSRTSTVSISDNASGSPHTVIISGTGTGLLVSPQVTALTFTRTQQFTASSGGVTWMVDGVVGGSTTSGTITTGGLYTPPTTTGTHAVTASTSSPPQQASATVYISNYSGAFTYHYDSLRTGQNASESVLTLSNVNPTQFGKLFAYPTDGLSYSSPLYVANVNIPGQGFHNVVYVVTEHDSAYAFDADGLSTTPLWHVSFLKSGVTTVPCGDTGECGDIPTEIGVTGTPVIDQTTGTMYVVSATKENANYVQRLHALDITTGVEKFGGPVVLQASVAGTGAGTSGGKVPFDSLRENQRPGLLLSNGVIYIAFASHGDQMPWHGWVLGYNATTLQQTMAYLDTPDSYGGGIWQSNSGLAVDATGNIYFTTGNGGFDANTGGRDYGDSIEKLSPAGSVVDYFTPHDQAVLESANLDLSSAGPVLLLDQPGAHPHILISASKNGNIYVVDRDNMGHYNPSSDNQILQTLVNAIPNGTEEEGNYSAPVFFNGFVYFAAVNDSVRAFQLSNGQLLSAPVSKSTETYPNRGGSMSASANGINNGILWAVQDNSPSTGVLYAYDASNLANELYNSTTAPGNRDSLGLAAKFVPPTVANGKVFIVTQNQLVVYGLLP